MSGRYCILDTCKLSLGSTPPFIAITGLTQGVHLRSVDLIGPASRSNTSQTSGFVRLTRPTNSVHKNCCPQWIGSAR